jgi:exopolysaccharide biosynthesis polyprenyl glycosylphosphotransferase
VAVGGVPVRVSGGGRLASRQLDNRVSRRPETGNGRTIENVALDIEVGLLPSRAQARGLLQVEAPPPPHRLDLARHVCRLVALETASAVLISIAGAGIRFGDATHSNVVGIPYSAVALSLAPAWACAVALARGYDQRTLPAGPELYRRAVNGWIWLVAVIAFASFSLRADLSREFVAVTLPSMLVLSLAMRFAVRKGVHAAVRRGCAIHRAIVVGDGSSVRDIVEHMRRASYAGFAVVGVAVDGGDDEVPDPIARVGTQPADLLEAAERLGVDTIAVAGSSWMSAGMVRRLAWQLEGTGIQLVVAPALTDVAGPRIVVRPVDGLPLLHVDEPELAGARRVLKEVVERTAAVLLAVALSPLLVGISVAITLTSPGPVIYRQQRVGQGGGMFTMWKFRTMVDGAHDRRRDLEHLNETDAVLFKIRRDPRVTTVGRWLRRHSIDELPQLWNVVRGEMSLVGPRPPLQAEVERYGEDARRRLLVKPGMTGLWQVSGRADLSWDESVRLDLYYVENWSVALDALVLWKTLAAVIHGKGAY